MTQSQITGANMRNRYFDGLFADGNLVWMGQNTNHIPAHPAVTEAMIASIRAGEFNAYAPPLGFESLRAAIAADLGVPGEAMVTEGGVNALATVVRARCRPGDTFVTTDPTWKWPGLMAGQMGAEVIELPIWDSAAAYRLTPDRLAAAVDGRTRLIYLVDPNNPLGISYPREDIAAFCEIARKAGALLVHDCTYRDFAEGHVPALAIDAENAVCTLSFSKWLGLAGLRIGAIVAPPRLIEEFAPFSPSILGASVVAQRGAEAGLAVKSEWMATVRRINRRNQEAIRDAVAAIPGLSLVVWPSQANFLCLDTTASGIRPEALVEAFRRRSVMIRQGSYHTRRFGERFVKVSTTVPEEWAARFTALLPEAVEAARGLDNVAAQF